MSNATRIHASNRLEVARDGGAAATLGARIMYLGAVLLARGCSCGDSARGGCETLSKISRTEEGGRVVAQEERVGEEEEIGVAGSEISLSLLSTININSC